MDALAAYPMNAPIEVTIKMRRSPTRLAAYWTGLERLIEATECYPTAEHLHDGIKLDLGYTTPIKSISGEIVFAPDSVSMGRMDEAEFSAFFNKARKRILEVYGCDPWADEKTEAA